MFKTNFNKTKNFNAEKSDRLSGFVIHSFNNNNNKSWRVGETER